VITYGARGMNPWRYADVLKRHFDQLLEEGQRLGTVMCIPLHAYLVSQSHRIRPFEAALKHIASHADDVWMTTASEIAEYYRGACWDQSARDIARRGLATGGTGFGDAAA
jgi:hypothetical protein